MKKFIFFLLLHAFFSTIAMASSPVDHVPGEMIVQLNKNVKPADFIAKLNRAVGPQAGVFLKKTIVREWDIYLLGFDENFQNQEQLLEQSYVMPEVAIAQWNHIIEERSVTPDDPNWFQQADMSLINAPEAWMTSTGGVTFNGDTVVVAVMEKGALLTHPDLVGNRWWNWNEIPNDGIDNDGNGYVDDFGGWNPMTGADDTGNNGAHGTGVYGIIGATGNNSVGVAGVNWRVKMMNISGVDTDFDIIDACYYVFTMRRMYNQSNGKKGAFVVATNASFGYDTTFPNSSPNMTLWCSLFDSLGVVGVLNMGATTNSNYNVDVVGDMPTSCPSEYLVAVTNINTLGSFMKSGYGAIHVDLGAPGQGTYTTTNFGNNMPGYGSILGGTSYATPHVTGSVALLYSLGCEEFTSDAITNPSACARRVRDAILNNTTPNDDLAGITATGGQLDLKKAIDGVTELCKGTVGPLEVLEVRTLISGNEVRLFYQTPIFLPYRFRVFNMLGQQLHNEEITPRQFSENYVKYNFDNLPKGVYVLSISRGNAIVSVKFPKI